MKLRSIFLMLLAFVAIFVIFKRRVITMYTYLKDIFVKFERFTPKPYWDVRQWSWGYGTRVPGSSDTQVERPDKTITKVQALIDAYKHVDSDSKALLPLVRVPLNEKQKAAILSFSYNLGQSAGKKLIEAINNTVSGVLDYEGITYKFKAYNKVRNSEGVLVKSDGLVSRRAYEAELFKS